LAQVQGGGEKPPHPPYLTRFIMSAAKASLDDGASPAAVEPTQEEGALSPSSKTLAIRCLIFGIFQSVLAHVLALQSEVTIFSEACGGNQALTARALASTTAIGGISGLFLNQIGGKLSDSLGRKVLFLSGPLMNIMAALAFINKSKNVGALLAARVVKSIFTTFSGTVMCQASLADITSGAEMAVISTRIQVAVGIAVILGPYIESILLKVGKGDPRTTFKALFAVSLFQMINNGLLLPETLNASKRKSIASFFQSLASFNPFAFVKVYLSEHAVLKKLLTIQTLQFCCDGKVTSDLFQMWSRNQLQWQFNTIRDFVVFWGAAVTAGAAKLHPYLLKKLSVFEFTTVGNLFVWAGLTIHGLAQKGWGMWVGVPFLIPGVNGGNAHAVKAMSVDLAVDAGYGNGEFSGWANNMRALAQSVDTVFLGMWYAMCVKRGYYVGSTWWIAGFIGGGLPQLLLMTMNKADLKKKEEKEAAAAP